MKQETIQKPRYLTCEKWGIFALLMFVGGFYGAYTFLMRGGVFCNAQTGNLLLAGVRLAQGRLTAAAYYIIPFCGYVLGTVVSEILPGPVKRRGVVRWDTLLIGIEILAVILLGFIPNSAPFQISQIIVNVLCAMQFNTFRQMEGIPMATTFCTNHVRQVGVSLVKAVRFKDVAWRRRFVKHSCLVLLFVAGVVVSAVLCGLCGSRAIWFALIPLLVVGGRLLHADLKTEKAFLYATPHGH